VESADARHSNSELLPRNTTGKDELEGDHAPAASLVLGGFCFDCGF
jgi:hypothetical protein